MRKERKNDRQKEQIKSKVSCSFFSAFVRASRTPGGIFDNECRRAMDLSVKLLSHFAIQCSYYRPAPVPLSIAAHFEPCLCPNLNIGKYKLETIVNNNLMSWLIQLN